jgi:hypothetical protein
VAKMTPAIERLIRLMVLLPEHNHPLWKSVIADCGDTTEVMSMRWFVGDAAKMWPEGGPRNLANAVLTAFGAPSEATLRLIADAILHGSGRGPQAGAAWVAQANAAAIEVLAQDRDLVEVLQQAKEHWTLNP